MVCVVRYAFLVQALYGVLEKLQPAAATEALFVVH
jgi:hypothetical protein